MFQQIAIYVSFTLQDLTHALKPKLWDVGNCCYYLWMFARVKRWCACAWLATGHRRDSIVAALHVCVFTPCVFLPSPARSHASEPELFKVRKLVNNTQCVMCIFVRCHFSYRSIVHTYPNILYHLLKCTHLLWPCDNGMSRAVCDLFELVPLESDLNTYQVFGSVFRRSCRMFNIYKLFRLKWSDMILLL